MKELQQILRGMIIDLTQTADGLVSKRSLGQINFNWKETLTIQKLVALIVESGQMTQEPLQLLYDILNMFVIQ